MEVEDETLAKRLLDIASAEAWRIESKFSRYRDNNIVHQINNSRGRPVKVDDEISHLLDFAHQCWELSEGLFDITSGVFRRVWRFNGGSKLPDKQDVDDLLACVGWHKVNWSRPFITLPDGMEIDFGGIGKEYAVDRSLLLLQRETSGAILVNYGGDIHAKGQRKGGKPWSIGIENPSQLETATGLLKIKQGALATSGDARRFILNNGRRYGHVLNPKTGWPVEGALRSVTVAGSTCTEAGLLATLALLQGEDGEAFLKSQDVAFWVTP
ncbi:MAG: FAD:protein FMN transferase [Candidatus Thiodiazotropha sp. LLP2]